MLWKIPVKCCLLVGFNIDKKLITQTFTSAPCLDTWNKLIAVCINEAQPCSVPLVWQLYICSEMHCPSCTGWRTVGTRWFLFVLTVCYWVNSGNTASLNQHSSSLSQAGDYLCSTVALLSAPPSCRALLKKTHRGPACWVKQRDVMKLLCTKLCWDM